MSDNMKKFGLEFVLENKSKQAFAQIMDQQRRLEKQLNNNIKAFNKFQSAVNNTSLESSIKKMDKLTNSVKRYNDALAGAKGGSLDPTGGGGLSGAVKDFMTADYFPIILLIYYVIGNTMGGLLGCSFKLFQKE